MVAGAGLDVVKLLQLLPKDTVTKILQVQAALAPDEQADAMQILRREDAEGLADLIGVFDAATLEESTDFLRRLVVDWRATRAGATKTTTNGGGANDLAVAATAYRKKLPLAVTRVTTASAKDQ